MHDIESAPSRYCHLFLCLSICLIFYLSGCVVKSQEVSRGSISPQQIDNKALQNALVKIEQLENKNRVLADKYTQQKELATELQMRLLKEHSSADNYLQISERLVSDLLVHKKELLDRGKRIESVQFVVEVIAAIVDAIKRKNLDTIQKDLLYWAEQYLSESKLEIQRKNYDGASYLCRLAMEQVQQTALYTNTHGEQENTKEIRFLSPLSMKLLKKSNLRTAPSIKAKVHKMLDTGSLVTVLGYKGKWVNVSVGEHGDEGWIYYSLLY